MPQSKVDISLLLYPKTTYLHRDKAHLWNDINIIIHTNITVIILESVPSKRND